jgi:hypothetical protein
LIPQTLTLAQKMVLERDVLDGLNLACAFPDTIKIPMGPLDELVA